MVSKSMLSSLLEKQLTRIPQPQPYFAFLPDAWQPVSTYRAAQHTNLRHEYPTFKALRLITWNIDFMAPFPRARMAAALGHLESVVSQIPASTAVCIFLQEMCEQQSLSEQTGGTFTSNPDQEANDLTQICNSAWIRKRFHVTDIDDSKWNKHYGTVTLVDRRLHIADVTRLRFVSEFDRDALLVDVPVGELSDGHFMRLCNVHLDSMSGPMRPIQWKGVAAQLQSPSSSIIASILAGDCNANQPRDQTEPQENGFKDAYLELGGTEGDEDGVTWGF